MAKQTKTPMKKVDLSTLRHEKTPQYQTLYSNFGSVSSSRFDIAILFGEVIDGHYIEERCRVVMNPLFARHLMVLLQQTVAERPDLFKQIGGNSLPTVDDSNDEEPPP